MSRPRLAMTPARLRVLTALHASCARGLPASTREVGALLGFRSSNAVGWAMRRLVEDGYVEVDGKYKSRAYRVVAAPVLAGDPARVVGFIPRGRG